jgi:hypothetical protein
MKMKTASRKDFKKGAKLTDKHDARICFTLIRKESDGIWIGRGNRGDKCIFESEANGYYVE